MASTRMMMTAVAFAQVLSTAAWAAPFCLRNQAMTPLCIYQDAASCQREATRQNGVCSINAREIKLPRGIGQYCVVLSSGYASCAYGDRDSCARDATRQNGICTDSQRVAPYKAPDPDSPINGR